MTSHLVRSRSKHEATLIPSLRPQNASTLAILSVWLLRHFYTWLVKEGHGTHLAVVTLAGRIKTVSAELDINQIELATWNSRRWHLIAIFVSWITARQASHVVAAELVGAHLDRVRRRNFLGLISLALRSALSTFEAFLRWRLATSFFVFLFRINLLLFLFGCRHRGCWLYFDFCETILTRIRFHSCFWSFQVTAVCCEQLITIFLMCLLTFEYMCIIICCFPMLLRHLATLICCTLSWQPSLRVEIWLLSFDVGSLSRKHVTIVVLVPLRRCPWPFLLSVHGQWFEQVLRDRLV